MALTLVTTVSGASSNSYATGEEADAYFEAVSHFSTIWGALTSTERNQKLVMAARAIDRFNFRGQRADPDQAMEFPRNIGDNVPDYMRDLVQVIPAEVKRAQLEMVLFQHFNADATTGQMARDVDQVDIDGALAVKFTNKPSGQDQSLGGNLETVRALLRKWTVSTGFALEK